MTTWRKLFSVIVWSWILLVSVGVTISSHWCGGEFKGVTFFGELQSCQHVVAKTPTCHHIMADAVEPCCQEKVTCIQSFDEEAPVPSFNLARIFGPVFSLFRRNWRPRIVLSNTAALPSKATDSSPHIKDIPVFIQTFRI